MDTPNPTPMENALGAVSTNPPANQVETSGIKRNEPVIPDTRRNLVQEWLTRIHASERHFEDTFKQMAIDEQVATEGASKEWVESGKYVVPIIGRYINQAVASLYAKNPTAVAVPRRRLPYKIWDGELTSLQEALANPADPNNAALIADVAGARDKQQIVRRVGRTLECLFDYFMNEPEPNIKQRMKQMIRRSKVNSVGYIWLDYQRLMGGTPELTSQIEDVQTKLAAVEQMAADVKDGEEQPDSSVYEQLRTNLADLQKMQEVIVREGPVLDFPKANEIIPDKACTQLSGFIGARWIARKMHQPIDKIKQLYKIDLSKGGFTQYLDKGHKTQGSYTRDNGAPMACVYIVYDKVQQQTFVLIDGYADFAKEPASPELTLETFWPCVALVLNPIEQEGRLYPPSDPYLLRHPQADYNDKRQSKREHGRQNRPIYATGKGQLEQSDKDQLRNPTSGSVVELTALAAGSKVEDLLQVLKPAPMDAQIYNTADEVNDVLYTVGAQEANLGPTNSASATQSSIAENSRTTSLASNIDDIDEFLSTVARLMGQIMLLMLDAQTVTEIAGEGAAWPTLTRADLLKEIDLSIKAGSSGKPNAAAELANIERVIPLISQIPGINLTPVAMKVANLLDIDTDEFIQKGLPSTVALNAMMSKAQMGMGAGTGPASDPAMQGQAGGDNAPVAAQNEPGPQPGYPAPGEATGQM